jgi:hypothetical protein
MGENTLNIINEIRLIDDQPPDLALVHCHQPGGHDPDMPVCRERYVE